MAIFSHINSGGRKDSGSQRKRHDHSRPEELGGNDMKRKKIGFSKPRKIEIVYDEFDEKSLESEEVIIRNKYSLISPGTELARLSGIERGFKFPSTPGYISVGEVITTGNEVSEIKNGDIVFSYGPHSEFFKINVDKQLCLKLPDGLKEEYAPFARMAAIAITALRASDIELGDFVGVIGLGLVGNLAAQLVQLQGATVIGIDLSLKRLKIAEECGIKFTEQMNKDIIKSKVMHITSNNGVSTLIEATGIPSVVIDSLPLISKRGEIILLGSPRGEFKTDLTEVLNYIHLANRGSIQFKGAHEWRYPVKHNPFVKHSRERNTKIIFKLIKNKRLKIKPLLTHILKPEEAEKAYNGLKDNKDEFLGVLFNWQNSCIGSS